MGWSFGNATVLSLFSDPDAIPRPLYETVEPYMMNLILYGQPTSPLTCIYLTSFCDRSTVGYTLPGQESFYNPFADPDCSTPEQTYDNFQHWVSSYYDHPDITSGETSGLSFEKRTEKRTCATWTDEQKAKYFDTSAAVRIELPAYAPPMQGTLKAQTHAALFNESLVSSYFPNVNVVYISGSNTCYSCMWGYTMSSRLYKDAVARGEKVRRTKFKLTEGGNHFVSDHPL
ncbi:hypothetical protein B0H13DRAFT_1628696 [Mycena leptocephala]|nr:hypothetical protein B0H13DRAFT_1628696 [Mycena leptocephala]